MQGAPGDRLIDRVLSARAAGEPIGPDATALLLRAWAQSGRADVADAAGLAVARMIDDAARHTPWSPAPSEGRHDPGSERAAWLALLVEVAGASDDARVVTAIERLAGEVAGGWPSDDRIGSVMRGVDACLRAAAAVMPSLASRAVDELERLIGRTYQPGSGVQAGPGDAAGGGLDDHVQTAAALLTGYEVAGRLPYAMLADDLMLFARRVWWAAGVREPAGLTELAECCAAARVLARLGAVHADPRYVQSAVRTEGCDHLGDAARLLAATEPAAARFGPAACIHSLAAGELASALKISDASRGIRD